MNSQQAAATSQPNNALNNPKEGPFELLLPVILPQLDKDQARQLKRMYDRLKINKISKDAYVKHMRSLVGDHFFRQAVSKLKKKRQQQRMQFFQSSFPPYGTTGSNCNQYAGGNMHSSMQPPKQQPQKMQANQVQIHPDVTGNLSNDSIGMQDSRMGFSTSTSIMQSNTSLSAITTQMGSSNSASRSSKTAPNQVASNIQIPAQQQHMNSSKQSLKLQPQNIYVKLQAEIDELKKEKADLENRLKVALSQVEGFHAQKSSWDEERTALEDKLKKGIARAVKAESSNSELASKLQTCEAVYKGKVQELQSELEEVRPDIVKIMDVAVSSFQDGYSTCADMFAASREL